MEKLEPIYASLQMDEITDQFEPQEMEEQKTLMILSLIISILFFLPYVSYKDSAYAKETSNQLLTIFLVNLVNVVIIKSIPLLGGLVSALISLVLLALIILKIYDATQGKIRKLPFGFSINAFK